MPKPRITPMTELFLYGFLSVYELIGMFMGAIPVVGQIYGFAGEATVFLWLMMIGVKVFSGKKAGQKTIAMMAAALAEFLPFVGSLPALLVSTFTVVQITKQEDKEKAAAQKAKLKAANDNAARQQAANDNNARQQADAA